MDNRLERYFNQLLTEQEKEEFFRELDNDKQLREEYILQKNLRALINAQEQESDYHYASDQYNTFEKKIRKRSIRTLSLQLLKYAAVILITIGCYTLYTNYLTSPEETNTLWSTVETPAGQRTFIQLPDGTGVWLNAGTKLSYPANFSSKKRRVNLEGEAYFEVFSDKENPFHIETDYMNVDVLGTKFNLKSYPEESTRLTLIEGKVEISPVNNETRKIILSPNEQATLSESGELTIREVYEADNSHSWTSGEFFYLDETLENISRDLERRFAHKIIIQDRSLENERFTYRANEATSLDEIIRHLGATKEIKFNTRDNYTEIVKP